MAIQGRRTRSYHWGLLPNRTCRCRRRLRIPARNYFRAGYNYCIVRENDGKEKTSSVLFVLEEQA
jgi:hypothetical protein